MNQFFGMQYSQEDLQARLAERRNRNASLRAMSMSMAPPTPHGVDGSSDTMDMNDLIGAGDSWDDIIMQNNKDLHRRQSLPRLFPGHDDRRVSMFEFGSSNSNINGFQFEAPNSTSADPNLRHRSTDELGAVHGYAGMSPGMDMQVSQLGFPSSVQTSEPLTIDTSGVFLGMDMVHDMIGYGTAGLEGIPEEDSGNLNIFSPADFSQTFESSMEPMSGDFMIPGSAHDQMHLHHNNIHEETEDMMPSSIHGLRVADNNIASSPRNMSTSQNLVEYQSPVGPGMPQSVPNQERSYSVSGPPSAILDMEVMPKKEGKSPVYQNIYSSSGFDMLGALMRVATRRNPEINIGKVDMSCAFVVCDVTQVDCPIVYVSDIFERLTGYTKHEVLGRNCRFLQSPEGKVQAGLRREFVDNDSVYYLKNRIGQRKEAQRSLINYRKGGQPFMNLLTMIPITGENDDDGEIKYYVGFQVDLVEKPTSVEGKNASGLYTVDYSQGMLPKYVWQPPDGSRGRIDGGQTISRDDVSTVLTSINNGTESELTKRMWDKVLLENTDDVVHVLSLKGLFLYLSPSSRHVLEYDASELVGTALSSVCHPSDIVPVTRELKDTSTGATVNVVFRIRRKKSGYTWFESHGSLCVEQGKGRKCIILVGRERHVYALGRHDIEASGGLCEGEMWTKLSTSGMFLFVSSNVRTLLDRSPDDLLGTSMHALMRSESKIEFGRSLEKARTGKKVTHKHEVLNKRGLVLQAQTTLYPGDASEGQKPTFLVAQTRLLKNSSRAVAPAVTSKSSNSLGKQDPHSDESPVSHPSAMALNQDGDLTPRSTGSLPGPITQAGGQGLAIGNQDLALASEDNIFDELKTTRCTSWQFELRQMEKSNRLLAEELAALLSNKKKRKRRKGAGHLQRDCANCHTHETPEWRRGPSGQRDLCNSCGLRWAKQTGRMSPRNSTRGADSASKTSQPSTSPISSSPLQKEMPQIHHSTPNLDFSPTEDRKWNYGEETVTRCQKLLDNSSTTQSQPVPKPNRLFKRGGRRSITRIDEEIGSGTGT